MTLACTSICNETCPAAVSSVTLVTNVFNLGEGDVNWIHAEATVAGDNVTITLPSLPAANTLKLFKNGQQIDDFELVDDTITLDVAKQAEDVFVYDYLPQPA